MTLIVIIELDQEWEQLSLYITHLCNKLHKFIESKVTWFNIYLL